jgi:hypothetical protein
MKSIGLTLLFGLLSIIITIGLFFVIVISAVLAPFLMVFTGLWGLWFITRDYDEKPPD